MVDVVVELWYVLVGIMGREGVGVKKKGQLSKSTRYGCWVVMHHPKSHSRITQKKKVVDVVCA